MKSENPRNSDATLNTLLETWRPGASLPPRFGEQVLHRVELLQGAGAPDRPSTHPVLVWLMDLLAGTRLAAATALVLISLGAGLGWSQARQQSAAVTGQLEARYAQALDPYSLKP